MHLVLNEIFTHAARAPRNEHLLVSCCRNSIKSTKIHLYSVDISAFAAGYQKLRWSRPFLCVKLLSDEPDMPAIEKDKSIVVKSVMASQKVVQGRLTDVTWLSGSTEWMTIEATFIAGFWSTELKISAIDAQGRFRNHYYHQHNKTMRIYVIFEWVGCSIFNVKKIPKYVDILMTHFNSKKKIQKNSIENSTENSK